MADSPNQIINEAKALFNFITFCKQDDDLVLYRRFKELHLLNIYYNHAELIKLSKLVSEFSHGLTKGNRELDMSQVQKLLEELGPRLDKFDKALMLYEHSLKPPNPASHLKDAIKKWVIPDRTDLAEQYDLEAGPNRMAAWSTTKKGVIQRFVDRHRTLNKFFCTENTSNQQSTMHSYSEVAVRRLEDVIVNATFCVLVLIPIFVLSYLHNKIGKLWFVAGFVLASSVVTSFLANATHKNGLAVMAAYTAILVVFLSNNPGM